MNLGQWEGKAGNYLETEDTGILHWADLTQYWGSWALWGAGWVKRAGWRRAGQWGQPGHHVPEEWTEFKCPKLEAALESWGSSWDLGITALLLPALPTLQPCSGDHQNIPTAKTGRAESRGWGLLLAFPAPLVDFSCPTLSAVGQAAQTQSSAPSTAPQKGLQIARVRGSCTGNSTRVNREHQPPDKRRVGVL